MKVDPNKDDGTPKSDEEIEAEEKQKSEAAESRRKDEDKRRIKEAIDKYRKELEEEKRKKPGTKAEVPPPTTGDEIGDRVVNQGFAGWTEMLPSGSGTITVLPQPNETDKVSGAAEKLKKHEFGHVDILVLLYSKLCGGGGAPSDDKWKKAVDAANEKFHQDSGNGGAPAPGGVQAAVNAGVAAANKP